jgi:hypothetical protein
MYNEASLDPERCTQKSDYKARRNRLTIHLRQIDQYEDINRQSETTKRTAYWRRKKPTKANPQGQRCNPTAVEHMHTHGAQQKQER